MASVAKVDVAVAALGIRAMKPGARGGKRRAQLDPLVVELEAAELEVVGGPTKSVTATGSTLLKCFAMTPCANVSGWKTSGPVGGGRRCAAWHHWPPGALG